MTQPSSSHRECLWVRDARAKNHPAPESLRCQPQGTVFCANCWKPHPPVPRTGIRKAA